MSGTPPTITNKTTSGTTPAGAPSSSRGRLSLVLALAGWLLVAGYFVTGLLVLSLRYWILPDISRYSTEIEQAASRAMGERVSIGQISAHWQGLHPELELSDVRVYDDQGNVALELPAVEAVIGWRSLVYLSLRLHSLVIDQPNLDIRRDASGKLFVAGIGLRSGQSDSGTGDWLLSQSEIVIRNARISWFDEQRGAPLLELSGLTFMLRNSGTLHRFALRAQTDNNLASTLDVRGEFHGESLEDLRAWRGQVFAELDYVDLSAWKAWIDYPFDLASGKGALRLWMTTDGERITAVNADVALAGVRARLAEDLPLLDLEYLHGRLGGSRNGVDTSRQLILAYGSHLTLKSVRGNALPPADFSLRWEGAGNSQPERGELQATSLEFEPLANLAEFLPFPKEARARLLQIAPRGSVNELKLSWTGELEQPVSYSVRGKFSKMEMKAPDGRGAFTGLSGEINATKAGGNLRLNSENVLVEVPGMIAEGRARFDRLSAQIGWAFVKEDVDVKFAGLSFANSDGMANLNGSFTTRSRKSGSLGVVDLTGQFNRLDAKSVYNYIPALPKSLQDYLKDSLLAGQSNDVRLRLKGDLQDFPYADGKSGIFEVNARVVNGVFRYAEGWPQVVDVNADLRFDGKRMQIVASRATVLGTRATGTRIQIPDMYGDDERVLIESQAEGPSAEFLRFIEQSPVTRYIDGATKGISATGLGRLQIKIDIPVRRLEQTKVTGSYQIASNQVDIDGGIPPLAQVSGRIDFTESNVAGRNLSAQFLGGQAVFGLASRPDGGIDVEAQGNASVAALRKFIDTPMLNRLGGSSTWRATLRAAQGAIDVNVESPLVGVTIALPEPFNKPAQELLPLKVEYSNRADADFMRRVKAPRLPTGGDAFAVTLGTRAAGVFLRQRGAGGHVLDRGAVGIGEPVPSMDRAGISVTGKLAHVDVDRWRAALETDGRGDTSGSGNLNLTIAALDFAGKRLNDVRLRAIPVGTAWTANVVARELAGTVVWRPEGAGRVVARLKHFTVPEAPPGPVAPEVQSRELPALDIVADDFVHNDKHFGRLELVAVNEIRDWRIEKLALVGPEGSFSGNGVWQSWAQRPSVAMNVRLDVSDIGGFLARIGYPGTMRSGTARLEGKVSWLGNPQSIDYPTLTGEITLTAANGQFLKAEPGIAKLLGILSMQTWITLDFRGLFGEGFSFDTISSTAQINKGVANTRDFSMSGRTAKVSMAGNINLAQETQDLKVRVVPSIGDGVSSIAVLTAANPAIGLIALLVQRVLGDPVGKIFAFDYTVLGTWSDPKVERTKIETPDGRELKKDP